MAEVRTSVRAALARTAEVGPFFAVTVTDTTAPDAVALAELYQDGEILAAAVDDLAVRLGTGERRVAASTLLLGHTARVWSVALGCWATSAVVPELAPASASLRTLAGGRVEFGVAAPTGVPTPVDEIQAAATAVGRLVVDNHLHPFVDAVHTATGTARGLLWGNAASSLVGTVRVLGATPGLVTPETTTALHQVAALLLARAPLAGATGHEVDRAGRLVLDSVVRRSCCLFYRVPNGGTCGDCPLTGSPAAVRSRRR